MKKIKPATVDEYIAAAPQQAREKLEELRSILKGVVPDATETLKWSSPMFEEKRILFAYSAFKSHLKFVPTRTTVEAFPEELADYTTGNFQFCSFCLKRLTKLITIHS